MKKERETKLYRSCSYIESGIVFFPSRITFCCYQKPPVEIEATGNISDVVNRFLEVKESVIKDNQSENPPCEWCAMFRECDKTDKKIRYINFSTHCYCQLTCSYCALQRGNAPSKNKGEDYDSIEIAKELKSRGLLAEKIHIDCAPGEIAIHPKRDDFYDFIEENAYSVTFYTNAVKYDERLAKILAFSPRNYIVVSMDSGTEETFSLVKGGNLFNKVAANLREYRKRSSQMILKYILLDENCNEADVLGFIELCKELGVARMDISADLGRKTDYMNATVPEEHIVNSAIELIRGAVKYKIKFSVYRKAFGKANLEEIYKRLLQLPEFSFIMKKFDKIFSSGKLICYGAGGNVKVMLQQIKRLGLREPDVFWDTKAKDSDAQICEKMNKLGGYKVSFPMLEALDSREDAVIISIINQQVNEELIHTMHVYGFENVMSQKEFVWALMIERFRRYGVDQLGW